jgi:aerobic C4-dicarboxylate transport protein
VRRTSLFTPVAEPAARTPLWRQLYVQVLVAIVLGLVFGAIWPKAGAALKPLGDAFVALIKMMIAPVIFCTIVHGISSMRDMAKVGRIGLKALLYFEVISTLALGVGLAAGHLFHPGVGFGLTPESAAATKTVAAMWPRPPTPTPASSPT